MSARSDDRAQRSARLLAAAGLVGGLVLSTRPAAVTAAVAPEYPSARLWVARLLGARLVVQHAVVLVSPGPGALRAVAVVDGLHAASMLPVLLLPRYRRAALVSGAAAAASALAAGRLAGQVPAGSDPVGSGPVGSEPTGSERR
ncbi:hypothetical protein [Blastococcus xanthinilyticus]|uniref:Uncharacterized protein n=1 Tax=Blastococcus xanthinilyticus TaxID=1564164 RepID=A0A5S5D3U1_9ACTN|nr:hypothetical protein [Blastococcus xanthinilyticus]TYP90697.1 hypothetical protein BD833_101415 [Blastococcus xanthinilyticus]